MRGTSFLSSMIQLRCKEEKEQHQEEKDQKKRQTGRRRRRRRKMLWQRHKAEIDQLDGELPRQKYKDMYIRPLGGQMAVEG